MYSRSNILLVRVVENYLASMCWAIADEEGVRDVASAFEVLVEDCLCEGDVAIR